MSLWLYSNNFDDGSIMGLESWEHLVDLRYKVINTTISISKHNDVFLFRIKGGDIVDTE